MDDKTKKRLEKEKKILELVEDFKKEKNAYLKITYASYDSPVIFLYNVYFSYIDIVGGFNYYADSTVPTLAEVHAAIEKDRQKAYDEGEF